MQQYLQDPSGKQWFEKEISPQQCLAEIVGQRFGWALRVRVPESCIYRTAPGAPPRWVMAHVEGTRWAPDLQYLLEDGDDLGRMLALDALLVVPDRHSDNVMLEGTPEGVHRLWAIDHDEAVAGHVEAFFELGAKSIPPDSRQIEILDLDRVVAPAMQAATEARLLSREFLQGLSRLACRAAGTGDPDLLAISLETRCAAAPQIVTDYLRHMRGGRR